MLTSAEEADSTAADSTATVTGLTAAGLALRQAREARSLSLHDLAGNLRMGEEQLAALEAGDRANLPEAVFIKAMVRRVADKLGLEPDALVRGLTDLDQERSRTKETPSRSIAAPRSKSQARPTPQRRPGWLGLATLSGLIAIAAVIAGLFSLNRITPEPSTAAQPSEATAVEPPTPPQPPAAVPTVTVTSQEPSWLMIRNAKGAILFEGMLKSSTTLRGERGVEIYAGRPDLVKVSTGEGNNASTARTLGKIDDVRWYRVTAEPSPSDSAL
ncbi:transcriptional regulator with a Cro/C1-type helix-turn-helix domain [Synechococcus sp. RS9909]|uniref:helix-turn-helix domain-containing protein n=1 Tax=unclassified Synechococcus TaxID=2626047 RepID=UPI000068F737|nr:MULTISPECIES: helix-turn-helix domain-containing protein [unclassified Synechococcus]EAQ69578.1 hypothetical protein RS9917_09091 [Synechococcus sp. RS9917]QNI80150.1 transcriptional regulator with a Cro/C1-type helix-turn-helix domain [Synechococcus sp. RS9909]